MRDVLAELDRWWAAGTPVVMATVVKTWKSAPRSAGAVMLIGADGSAVGSVSGGCVEAAVYHLAQDVAQTRSPVLQQYGVSDGDALAVGLTCGGVLDVFVERVDRDSFPEFDEVAAAIHGDLPVAVVTCIATAGEDSGGRIGRRLVVFPDRATGSLGNQRLDRAVIDDVRAMLATGRVDTLQYGDDGERRGAAVTLFVATFPPPPRMIVFGATDFAAAVARIGVFLGYRVTVCDARSTFATEKRFPDADEIVVGWPHRYLRTEADAGRIDERTVVCVLAHEPRFEVPVLEVALRLPIAYVGAMGSRRTHDDRVRRLREVGLTVHELTRLSSPIGLDLGARTPQETAVSVAAEIIAMRWDAGGERLAALSGPIHAETGNRSAVSAGVPARPPP
jgi:xanthine dehydrogenase accessory factor